MKNLVYEVESNTLRQTPQNYLIAINHDFHGWTVVPDAAADKELGTLVFEVINNTHMLRFESGHKIVKSVGLNRAPQTTDEEIQKLYDFQLEKFSFIKFYIDERKNYSKPNRWHVYLNHGQPLKRSQCSASETMIAHVSKHTAYMTAFRLAEYNNN